MNYISYCGYDCYSCPAYMATKTNDLNLLIRTKENWSKTYQQVFSNRDMFCEGCKSGKRFLLCESCDIQACNTDKGNDNCKECSNYPCLRIQKFEDKML